MPALDSGSISGSSEAMTAIRPPGQRFRHACVGHIQHGMWTHPRERSSDYTSLLPLFGNARAAGHGWDQPPKVAFASDWPVEEGVTSEPVSGPAFPASWENTGNFVDSKAQRHVDRGKKVSESVSYGPFPYAS